MGLQARNLKGRGIFYEGCGAAGVHHHFVRGIVDEYFKVVAVSRFGLVHSQYSVVIGIFIRFEGWAAAFVGLAAR